MDPQIITMDSVTLWGVSFFGDPFARSAGWTEENEIGLLWKRFIELCETHREELPPGAPDRVAYELHIPHPNTGDTGDYEVFVGYPSASNACAVAPVEFLAKTIPGGAVALFTIGGGEIADMACFAQAEQWVEHCGRERRGRWIFNRYDERFRGMDRLDESTIELGFPLV